MGLDDGLPAIHPIPCTRLRNPLYRVFRDQRLALAVLVLTHGEIQQRPQYAHGDIGAGLAFLAQYLVAFGDLVLGNGENWPVQPVFKVMLHYVTVILYRGRLQTAPGVQATRKTRRKVTALIFASRFSATGSPPVAICPANFTASFRACSAVSSPKRPIVMGLSLPLMRF